MIWLFLVVGLVTGFAAGYFVCLRHTAIHLSKLSEEELSALAAKVQKERES